jgi:glucose-1-phosphate cytidylyltransferase
MKVVILAGGTGTRLSEETVNKPKPAVEIGGKPIIWHIMKTYSLYGLNDFIICCGYKGDILKKYFLNYFTNNSDIKINLKDNKVSILKKPNENWSITLVDTGKDTMTGGRIKRISNLINKNEDFCLTYGDGVSDVNINNLIKFHRNQKKIATVTAVQLHGRYGTLTLDKKNKNLISNFIEKPKDNDSWINGGFFVLNQKIFKYIKSDREIFERKPLEYIAKKKKLGSI